MERKIVSGLWVYPVKSLGGIALQKARLLPKGIEYDRRWMLIDETNTCMTQRDYPLMAKFKLSFSENAFTIQFESEIKRLSFHTNGSPVLARIWNDTVHVVETDEALSGWFSSKLGVRCRLVAFPEENPRPIDASHGRPQDHVSLADAYPLLIIGQRSLDDLNSKLNQPVPMNRFRPNIVFSGGEAFEEDQWDNFSIGNARMAAVKLCARCVLTTVDQDKGIKTGTEPLATLARYRKEGNKVLFGQNLVILAGDQISIGDSITLDSELTSLDKRNA